MRIAIENHHTDRDNGHQSSSERKYWKPVEDPLDGVGRLDENIALKLSPIVSQYEDHSGSNAAREYVDDDEESEAGSSIVGQEAECVGERDSKPAEEEDDESQSSPGPVVEEGAVVVQPEDDPEHDEGGEGVEQEVPDQVGDPEDSRQEPRHQLDLLGVGGPLIEGENQEGGDEDGEAKGEGDTVPEGQEGRSSLSHILKLFLPGGTFH